MADHGLAINWGDARYRVLRSYREWLRAVSDTLGSCGAEFEAD